MPRLDFYVDYKLFIQFSLKDSDVVLGRGSECTVQLPDRSVSRQHPIIRKRSDGYWLEDTSKHGTRVNATMIAAPTLQQHGDRIYIANFCITFQPDEAPPQELSEETTSPPH
jgi:pSer/pThr/pTyr-binding forkhead associated (FHA) protein